MHVELIESERNDQLKVASAQLTDPKEIVVVTSLKVVEISLAKPAPPRKVMSVPPRKVRKTPVVPE